MCCCVRESLGGASSSLYVGDFVDRFRPHFTEFVECSTVVDSVMCVGKNTRAIGYCCASSGGCTTVDDGPFIVLLLENGACCVW